MSVRWLAFAGAVVVSAAGVASADPVHTPDDEIVVTAPIEGSRLESLQGADVLRRNDVVEQLTGGIGETVATLPGVSSSFFGAGASRPVIRGLGDDRVRILQNGVGAIDASSASPDHAVTADGLDAERIEVLRGAAALAYGGNAVGGVINVIDNSIAKGVPENGFRIDGLAGVNSGDEGYQLNLGAAAAAGPLVFSVDVGTRESENYEIPGFARSAALRAAEPAAPGVAEVRGEAPNSFVSYDTYSGGVSLVRDWGFSGVSVKRTETEYGLAPEDIGSTLGGRIELEQTRVEARGDIRIDLGVFDRIDYAAQWSDYEHSEIEEDGEVAATFTNEGYELRLEAHHNGFGDKLDGAVGLQLSDTDFGAVGEEAFVTPTTSTDVGAFAVQRLDLGGWGLEGGLRLERRELDNVIAGVRDFDAASASAGAFVRPTPNWFIGATLARTERAPTTVELFADGPHLATGAYERGDAALDKETALSLELSARYTTERFRFEANAWRVDYADYIALVDSGLEYDKDNEVIGAPGSAPAGAETLPVFDYVSRDAEFTGGEVVIGADLFTLGEVTIGADAAADFVRAEFDAGGNVPRIPPRTLTLGLEARKGASKARIEMVDVAEQDDVAAFETSTEGYTLLNARLAWAPVKDNDRIRVVLDGRNLTDEEAREHISFLKDVLPRPGRSVRLALVAGF